MRGSAEPCGVELMAALGGARAQLSGLCRCLPVYVIPWLPTAFFNYQEEEAVIPSVQVHLLRWRRVWQKVGSALLRSFLQMQQDADYHRVSAPLYHPGQKVWLSAKDLLLQVDSPGSSGRSRWNGSSIQLPFI